MVLVLFFAILLLVLIAIILSTINIRIEKLELSNRMPHTKLSFDYKVFFELYFLNKVKFFSFKIDKKLVKRLNKKIDFKEKFKSMDYNKMKTDMPSKEEQKDIIKRLNIELTKFNLKLELGTIDVLITSGITAILASILGIVLGRVIKEYSIDKYSYEIRPLYNNENLINLSLNCIIKVKMVHIIPIIYMIVKKRRVDKNERTSNRRAYGYSYE